LTADKGARGKRDTGAFETKEKREGTVAVTE